MKEFIDHDRYTLGLIAACESARNCGVTRHKEYLESILDFYAETGLLYPMLELAAFSDYVKEACTSMGADIDGWDVVFPKVLAADRLSYYMVLYKHVAWYIARGGFAKFKADYYSGKK